jgi:hypothetical protein
MFRARLVNPLPFSTLKTPHSLILWQNIFHSVTSGQQPVTNGLELSNATARRQF